MRRIGEVCPIAAGVGNRVNAVWLYGPECQRSTWGVYVEGGYNQAFIATLGLLSGLFTSVQ